MNQFYSKNKNNVLLKENNLFQIVMLVILFISAPYFTYKGIKLGDDMPIWVVFILPICVYSYQATRRVAFNLDTKSLEISFCGFFTKEYDLRNFKELIIINHKMNFINNGKEVKMVFKGENNKEVSLIRKQRFKNTETFIKETKTIIESIIK